MAQRYRKGEEAPVEAPKSIPVSPKAPPTKEACPDCGSVTRKLLTSDEVMAQYRFRVALVGKRDIACWRLRRKAKQITSRNARQIRTFGITQAEKDLVIAEQGGGCICAPWTGYNGNSRTLSTDHDHETGEVRGALCKHCNDLIGRVHEDPAYFRAVLAYLSDPPAIRVLGKRIVPGGRHTDG